MKIKLLSSRNKIFVGFLCIAFICLVVIFVIQSLNNRQLQMKNKLIEEENILLEIQKINRLGLVSDNQGAYYFLSTSNDKKSQLRSKYDKNIEELNTEIKTFRSMLTRPEDIHSLLSFEKIRKENLRANDRAFRLEQEGYPYKAKKVYSEISFDDVKKKLVSMSDHQRNLVNQKQLEFEHYNLIIQRLNTLIIIVFMLFTITLGWILSRKIQLEHHMNAQKQFYQNTSHELRTPLMSIQGYAQAILDGTIERGKVEDSLKIIISESDRLTRMVQEMILLSKLENENNKFELQSVPVEYLIEESLFRISPLMKEKGLNVDLHQNFLNQFHQPLVKVDPEKCLQALLNIFSNAIRHAVQTINVSITEKGKQVWIDIKDDGAGISEEVLPNLFQRFYNGKGGENGLGLAIALAIIEQCGGSIKAWNDQDSGAVFRIILPRQIENKN